MWKKAFVGSLALTALAFAAPAAVADEPWYECRVRAVELAGWTDGEFEGVLAGYAVHAGDSSMSLTCAITVNGWVAASVSGGGGSGYAVSGLVRFAASRWDNVQVVATLSTAHGTQTRSYPYYPHSEAPVPLSGEPAYGCGIDSVKPGGPAGDNFEGVARGYVAYAAGGPVSVRCYVTVDGVQGQWGSTSPGYGSAVATTVGRVTFSAQPWSAVELVAEATTVQGTQRTSQPYAPYQGVPSDVGPGYDFGCSFRAMQQDDVTGQNFEGIAVGYVTHDDADVTIYCHVEVNGTSVDETPTGGGREVAITSGRVTFAASDTDWVQLCAVATTTGWGGSSDTRCYDTTATPVPTQGMVDALNAVGDSTDSWFGPLLRDLTVAYHDPLTCPFLAAFPGDYGPIAVNSQGDLFIDGEPSWDCPPYDMWGQGRPWRPPEWQVVGHVAGSWGPIA